MGRLPAVKHERRSGAARRPVRGLGVALGAALALACQRSEPERSRASGSSRVQAVLEDPTAKPKSTAKPESTAKPATDGAGERAAATRPPLCRDQLATAGKPIEPRVAAERRSLSGAELPKSPFERDARWHWINFWAAWCVPCREELPLLLSWQASLAERLRFSFVSLDDDERQLDAFLEQQPSDGLKSTYWLPDGAVRQAWLAALELETEPELPLQLLIDPSGKLRCRVEGAVDAEDLAALRHIVGG